MLTAWNTLFDVVVASNGHLSCWIHPHKINNGPSRPPNFGHCCHTTVDIESGLG